MVGGGNEPNRVFFVQQVRKSALFKLDLLCFLGRKLKTRS